MKFIILLFYQYDELNEKYHYFNKCLLFQLHYMTKIPVVDIAHVYGLRLKILKKKMQPNLRGKKKKLLNKKDIRERYDNDINQRTSRYQGVSTKN